MVRSSSWLLLTAALFAVGCSSSNPGGQNLNPGTPDPAHSSVAVDRSTAQADGSQQVRITATIRDASDKPVSGVSVSLSVSGQGNTVSTPAATGSDGTTSATLTSTVAEQKTITASIPQGAIGTQPTVQFVSGGVDATNSTVEVAPASVLADGSAQATVTVTLKDAHGNPVAGKTPAVSVSGASNTVVQPGASDASGVATATITSTHAETKTVTVSVVGMALAQTPSVDFVAGAASALAFRVQPSSSPAGAAITPAIQVVIEDAHGNLVDSSATVTLALSGGGAAVNLLGTVNVAAVHGIATFSDLSVDTAGTGFALVASSSGLTDATSSTFTVSAGAASHLTFQVQPPANSASGAAFSPAVKVAFLDANGNVDTTATGAVTLTLTGGTTGAQLSGTTTVNATAGVATFAGLSVDKAASGYALAATAAGVSGAASNPFSISAGTAAKLAFTTQPTNATAGNAIAPSVVVAVQDAAGNLVTAASGTVSLSLAANPGNDTLGGSVSQPVVNGVATFGNLSLTHAATGYTLYAQSSGLASVVSSAFAVVPATASKLVYAQAPSTVSAGAAISPAVQVSIEDTYNNLVSSNASITVALGANPGTATLAGTTTVAASGGIATFSSLSLNKTGTGYTLIASAQGLTAVTSNAFDVIPGAPAQLVFTRQPTNVTAGTTLSPSVQVSVEDASGNLVTSSSVTVTVAIGTNAGGATLGGTKAISAVNGVASFATLTLDKAGTGYTLTASSGSLTATVSNTFDVTPASATRLVFQREPSNATAGSPITPAVLVAVQDNYGNVVTTANDSITVGLAANPSGATLSGATTVAAVNGVATFSSLSLDKTGTGFALSASATGLSSATSASFSVNAASANKLVFVQQPSSAVAGTPVSPAIQVAIEDSSGNVVTSSNLAITVALGTNTTGATLGGTKTVAAVNGVASFSDLTVDKVGTGYTLSASASGIPAVVSSAFDVAAGSASRLAFIVDPQTTTAGQSISPAVQVAVQDAGGNTVTSFTGQVTVSIANNPSAGTLAGTRTVTASAGVATFSSLSIDKAGSGYTLRASATGLTSATSASFDISPGAATHLVFTREPSNTTAGVAISPSIQVSAYDANGNAVTTFGGGVTLSLANNPGSATLSGSANATAVGGVATFSNVVLNKVGSGYTLSASSTGLTSATSASFDVAAGTATTLVFTSQPSNVVAGQALSPAVVLTARDANGNTATGFGGTVSLVLGNNPGSATLGGATSVTASAGVATFSNLTVNKAGTGYTLVASTSGISSVTSGTFNVTAGSATQLVFTQQPTNAQAGANLAAVKVSAEDDNGNVVTSFTGSVGVALSANPGSATLNGTTSVTASAGVATFSTLNLTKAANGYSLSAASSGLATVVSNTFNVTPAAADHLTFKVQPSNVLSGQAISPAVEVVAQDAYANVVTSFSGTVNVALGTNPTSATLGGTTAVAAISGDATFSALTVNKAGTGFTLTASSTGVTGASSGTFNVTSAAATHLAFTVQPQNTTAGATLASVQVVALDASGNTATSFNGTISLTLGSNPGSDTLGGTTSVAASSGVATFNNLSLTHAANGYTLTASSSGLTGDTSVSFNVAPAAASKLVYVAPPASAMNDQTMAAVKVAVEDSYGNVISSDTRTVTIAIGTNPGGGTLLGTTTLAAVSGVASFANLSINKTGTGYTLVATGGGLTVSSGGFDITPAPITGLQVEHYVGVDGGINDVPLDLSAVAVNAYVPLSDGGFTTYAGTGASDGTFQIPGVPTVGYVLQVGAAYYGVGSTRTWDLGQYNAGRAGLVVADAGTQLAFNLTNMSPYDPTNDTVQLYSPETAAWGWDLTHPSYSETYLGPDGGDTSWQATTDYLSTYHYYPSLLIQASQGDTATVTQLTGTAIPLSDGGTVTYQHLAQAATVNTLEMVNGGTSTLTASLSPVTQNQSFFATFDFPSYLTALNGGNFNGGTDYGKEGFVYIDTLPHAEHGRLGATPDLMSLTINDLTTVGVEPMGFTYGTFAPTWPQVIAEYGYQYLGLSVPNPDGGTALRMTTAYYAFTEAMAADQTGKTVSAAVGPVRNITVAGQSAAAQMTAVGTQPVISWSAPTVGTPNYYRVSIRELSPNPSSPTYAKATTRAILTTPQTSIRVPPGVLASGKQYILLITAYADQNADPLQKPYLSALPFSGTQAMTSCLSP